MRERDPRHSPGSIPAVNRRFFYGWIIVGIVFLDNFAVSSHQIVFGVLIEPMSSSLSWSNAQLVGVFSIAAVSSGLAGPFIGPLIDRYGPRVPMTVASFAGGFLLLGIAGTHHLWQYYLLYGVLFGLLRTSVGDLVVGTTVANWFIRKRGMAYAVASMATPVAVVLLVPLAQLVVTHLGWRGIWIGFAILMWLFVCVPAGLFMRRRPEDLGLQPDGLPTTPRDSKDSNLTASETVYIAGEVNWTARQAISTPAFWLINVATTLSGGMAGPAILLYIVPYGAGKGLPPDIAAGGASILGVGMIVSRILWGLILSRIEVRRVFVLYALASACGVILLMATPPSVVLVYSAAAYVGMMIGGSYIISNVIWPDYFGRTSLGAIRGYTLLLSTLGRGLSPLLVAIMFDQTQSYDTSFALIALWYLIAAGVIYLAKRPVLTNLP